MTQIKLPPTNPGRLILTKFKVSSETMWHEINEIHGESGGVYILRCGDEKPIPTSRLLAKDEDGTLYIGKANSFINRVAELKKAYLLNITQALMRLV